MATHKETIEFILEKLRDRERFAARAMFGEYALYADGKVVALVCNDLLHVKISPASNELENQCEKGPPYPGAKPYYIVEEGQLSTIHHLPAILSAIAAAIPARKRIAAPVVRSSASRRSPRSRLRNIPTNRTNRGTNPSFR